MISAATLLLLLTAPAAADPDLELRSSLELVYQGHVDDALARLRAAAEARPEDPMAAYALALALCWKIEQRPETEELDRELRAGRRTRWRAPTPPSSAIPTTCARCSRAAPRTARSAATTCSACIGATPRGPRCGCGRT